MAGAHWTAWDGARAVRAVPARGLALLRERLGAGAVPRDAPLAEVVAAVPASRLPAHPLVRDDAEGRVRHARGQGFPDLVALRGGHGLTFPDGVAYPEDDAAVRELIGYAARVGARLIPFGGGTSVVGHISPLPGDRPVLSVDLRRLDRLHDFDADSGLATFGAGIAGPALEAQLGARGQMLGHFPQSFERSTLGGWVATRSSGQYSLGYGRIERLFAGGRVETPAGPLALPPFPASSAGPDLRELVLGSEGRLGIITRATVRIAPLPEDEQVHAIFFPDWEAGLAAVRELAQARLPLLMLRHSTPLEARTTLAMGSRPWLAAALDRYLALRGAGATKSLLLLAAGGNRRLVAATLGEVRRIVRRGDGVATGTVLGRQWRRGRFRTPSLRDALWQAGYAVDTVETAAEWGSVPALVAGIEGALGGALAGEGERVHAFTHLSHVYSSGSSVYTTFVFRLAPEPAGTLRRWRALKDAASAAIVAHGGTISHQHGVGLDHRPYLVAEKGDLGLAAIRAACAQFDPAGIMNPGKLLE